MAAMDTFAYQRNDVSVKDGAESVDVYVPLINTETNTYQGKVHLAKHGFGEMFCGTQMRLFQRNEADIDWVTQADPDKILCQRCKAAATKYLTQCAKKSA